MTDQIQQMPGLGRLHRPDERDHKHLMRRLTTPVVERKSKRWRMFSKPLDQGREGTCVAHGWRHFLRTSPIIQVKHGTPPTPREIYDECILIDEWTDNDHDPQRQLPPEHVVEVGHVPTKRR